ncbi:MAG: AI-2E family transporter [Bacteroidia bacterium]|nr:AI-2E family transporter [Bacteroidia bacterium]HQU99726.1 AI-2E family transporter [Bacteroidia bacterium]
MKKIKPKVVQAATLIVIIFLGLFILYALKGFLESFLGAVVVYVLFRNIMLNLCQVRKWSRSSAAILIILATFLIVLVPLVIVTTLFIPKLNMFFDNASYLIHTIENIDQTIKSFVGFEILSDENLKAIQTHAATAVSAVLSSTVNVFGYIAIMYFILYFMLIHVGEIEDAIAKYVPLRSENIARFGKELEAQTYSNAIGSPVLAIIQGLMASLGYWIFGLTEPLFWGIMTGFFSFVPFVGSAIIWLPAAIYLFGIGHTWQAIATVLYGFIVIGSIDNIFRFVFQKKFADVPPLITVFGVIVGFNLFGLVGLVFGPLMLSWFVILVEIYYDEYLSNE